MPEDIVSVDFEIFGVVQGVFFRKNTQDQANALGVKGWCKNTPQGTVQGQAQGPAEKIRLMKDWLQHTGSPLSRIEKAEFKNEHQVEEYTFQDFDVVRRKR